jgi:hypothetical protein
VRGQGLRLYTLATDPSRGAAVSLR